MCSKRRPLNPKQTCLASLKIHHTPAVGGAKKSSTHTDGLLIRSSDPVKHAAFYGFVSFLLYIFVEVVAGSEIILNKQGRSCFSSTPSHVNGEFFSPGFRLKVSL